MNGNQTAWYRDSYFSFSLGATMCTTWSDLTSFFILKKSWRVLSLSGIRENLDVFALSRFFRWIIFFFFLLFVFPFFFFCHCFATISSLFSLRTYFLHTPRVRTKIGKKCKYMLDFIFRKLLSKLLRVEKSSDE